MLGRTSLNVGYIDVENGTVDQMVLLFVHQFCSTEHMHAVQSVTEGSIMRRTFFSAP